MEVIVEDSQVVAAEFLLTLTKLHLFRGCTYSVYERFLKRLEDESH